METNNNIQTRRDTVSKLATGLGKLPPQAIEIEEAVLCTLLTVKSALDEVSDFLKSEHFYKDSHSKIYDAISNLYNTAQPVDVVTVMQKLKSLGNLELIGGAYYLTQITEFRGGSLSNVQHNARIIQEKFIQRELIRISTDTVNVAYDDRTDVFELFEKNQSEMFGLIGSTMGGDFQSMDDLVKESLNNLAKPAVEGLTGVGSGFTDLDALTGGWQPSDLIIIAARPAMGKTAFVLNCARNAAVDFKKPVAVFSLEMSSVQLTNRLISSETGIYQDLILKRKLKEAEMNALPGVLKNLSEAPIFIDDTPSLSVFEFRAKARRMKQKYDIQLIIVDYLQLMNAVDEKNRSFNREQEISKISRTLKAVAKELNIPVIALSQLSRAVESRAGSNKRPMLSDLRESGAIEQDADVVGFLHRPEYYGLLEDSKGESTVGLAEVIIAKNRNGTTDAINLKFNGSKMKFSNWSSSNLPTFQEERAKYDSRNEVKTPEITTQQSDDDDLPF